MKYTIALLKGDGIGPEVVDAACAVLDKTGARFGHSFRYTAYLAGGCALDATGVPLPPETVAGCKKSDAVLLGAVGGPKWDALPGELRPERALLGIRAALGLYSNLRPAKLYPALKAACPLRADLAEKGFDMVVVRELTGGIYFGERGRREGPNGVEAFDTETYSEMEIRRIGKVAFETAMKRGKKLVSVDKANVLESSRLWRETMHKLAAEYPAVEYADMLADAAAMQLVRNPAQFDVLVTSNLFGDVLSDEVSQITGSIGMLPSSSLGEGARGLYEPIHGSAPDVAGKDAANPVATILSAAMLLRYSLSLDAEADAIEKAVDSALNKGWRTADIFAAAANEKALGTKEMTARILEEI
jgi:3-isopropylmalate dehydrogenase